MSSVLHQTYFSSSRVYKFEQRDTIFLFAFSIPWYASSQQRRRTSDNLKIHLVICDWAYNDMGNSSQLYHSVIVFLVTVFSLLRSMMQCEAHRSIIRITQEQHFASSAARHTPHTIPPPLRCETYNRSGEVPSRIWNILFDSRKATLTVRYVNNYYDIFFITNFTSISFSITIRSILVLSPEIFGVTIHYFVKRVTRLV